MLTRRELLSAAVALPASGLLDRHSLRTSSAAPPPRVADAMAHVHPELRPALEGVLNMGSFPPLTAESLSKQRQMMTGFASPVLPSPAVTARTIAGLPDAPPVRLFVAGNAADASKPAALHIHGGGYVMGSAEMSRRDIQQLATAHNCGSVGRLPPGAGDAFSSGSRATMRHYAGCIPTPRSSGST